MQNAQEEATRELQNQQKSMVEAKERAAAYRAESDKLTQEAEQSTRALTQELRHALVRGEAGGREDALMSEEANGARQGADGVRPAHWCKARRGVAKVECEKTRQGCHSPRHALSRWEAKGRNKLGCKLS